MPHCQLLIPLLHTVGQHMPGLLVSAVTNVGHNHAASLELSAHTGVNTLRTPPALLQQTIFLVINPLQTIYAVSALLKHAARPRHAHLDGNLAIALVALEAVRPLLHALHFNQGRHHDDYPADTKVAKW